MGQRNQEVINQEVTFGDEEELVSTTDTRGVITYANAPFCRVAGYGESELINKNHNIVRHPDMPKAAFKDMWDHLKAGQAWRGAVKNRCKDGRYYWVDAFVTPIFENGTLTGYQSVRSKLAPEIRSRAEKLYAVADSGKKLTLSISLNAKQRISLLFCFSLACVAGGIFVSPFIPIAIPLATLLAMYHEVFIRQRFYDDLKSSYDSISRLVFCNDASNHAEYHLRMQQGRISTILGRTSDSSGVLLKQVKSLETASKHAHENVALETIELEKVATAMEEMVLTIAEVARNSALTSEQVHKATLICESTSTQMLSTQDKVSALANEVNESATSTQELSNQLQSIVKLMSEIQGIAQQTNLLALNAAIEAARAGDQGRGFAVVADEVRALSQRTHVTTENIQESMANVMQALQSLSNTMQHGQTIAKQAVEDTGITHTSIQELSKVMHSIEDAAMQISTATEQQTAVAHEINVNISSIRDASQANLTDADQVTLLAHNIENKAMQLSSMGLSFKG
jgi:aerotaxis receptor